MTLYQFNTLSNDKKHEAVWKIGDFVADRRNGQVRNLLYQLNDFYVELVYNGNHNQIKDIRSFKQGVHLEPYLKQIDITTLIKNE